MSNQPGRDPRAPKRNVSAYLLYQNAMREEFKAANPGMSVGRVAKYTSAMYTALPPAERETWEQRALADRARYRHELANYEYGIAYSKFRARAAKAPIGTRFMTMGWPIILKNATHAFRPK